MNKKIYVVMHNESYDGCFVEAIFSKKEDAEKLIDMYAQSDNHDDYNFYYLEEQEIDEKDINNYYLSNFECEIDDNTSTENPFIVLNYKEE